MNRQLGTLVIVAVLGTALVGCAGQTPEAAPTVTVPPVVNPSTAPETGTQPTVAGPGQVTRSPSTTPSMPSDADSAIVPAEEGAAVGAASGFVAAFIAKDVAGATWQSGWEPFLAEQARAAYEDTDQRQVPGSSLTGTPAMQPGGTNGAAIVDVPTDAGTFQVQLNQVNGSWRVLRAVLPSAEG